MKEELIQIARILMKVASRNERDVISQYIHAVKSDKINTARILADELVDFYKETNSSTKKITASSNLYDKTMEYYEIINL